MLLLNIAIKYNLDILKGDYIKANNEEPQKENRHFRDGVKC